MNALSASGATSRGYTHRTRTGFLIALWLAKNAPEAFSKIGGDAQEIITTMLTSQSQQKLGRRPKPQTKVSGEQASLLWRIRDAKTSDQKALLRHTCSFGLDLVKVGWISIQPNDGLNDWKLVLSPDGEIAAKLLDQAI